jgi:hypothetical protein
VSFLDTLKRQQSIATKAVPYIIVYTALGTCRYEGEGGRGAMCETQLQLFSPPPAAIIMRPTVRAAGPGAYLATVQQPWPSFRWRVERVRTENGCGEEQQQPLWLDGFERGTTPCGDRTVDLKSLESMLPPWLQSCMQRAALQASPRSSADVSWLYDRNKVCTECIINLYGGKGGGGANMVFSVSVSSVSYRFQKCM